jgi:hypothetical protein
MKCGPSFRAPRRAISRAHRHITKVPWRSETSGGPPVHRSTRSIIRRTARKGRCSRRATLGVRVVPVRRRHGRQQVSAVLGPLLDRSRPPSGFASKGSCFVHAVERIENRTHPDRWKRSPGCRTPTVRWGTDLPGDSTRRKPCGHPPEPGPGRTQWNRACAPRDETTIAPGSDRGMGAHVAGAGVWKRPQRIYRAPGSVEVGSARTSNPRSPPCPHRNGRPTAC